MTSYSLQWSCDGCGGGGINRNGAGGGSVFLVFFFLHLRSLLSIHNFSSDVVCMSSNNRTYFS